MPSKTFEAAMKVVQAEIVARRLAHPPVKPVTKIVNMPWQKVVGSVDIVRVRGSGRLKHFKVKSPTNAFSVLMVRDGSQWTRSYADLEADAQGYEEDGVYYVHISDLGFRESLIVAVSVPAATTFQLLHVELDVNPQ